MTDLAQVAEAAQVRPSRRRGVRVLAIALAVVLVVALTWTGARWLRSPTTLEPYSGVSVTGTMPLGTTFYADAQVGQAIPPAEVVVPPEAPVITVLSATPRVVENTTGATVELLLCTRNGSSTGVGLQVDGLEESCSSLEPLTTPTDVALSFMTAQLVLRFTGVERGTLEVDGVDIEYRDGLRQGTQQVGGGIRLDFAPESELPAP